MSAAPSEWMRAALDAAEPIRGLSGPNPWVGAAIVSEGRLVATGATEPPPGRHAERTALDSAGEAARGATLFCTLEPCAPFEGKRTPACSDGIIEAGVVRVVVAHGDPDVRVGGQGVARLRAAGIDVVVGDGREAALRQLRPYIKHRETGLPYVIAKFAATLDGRIATATGDSRWITGEQARARVHEERARVDAVIAGSGTVLADDPALTARPGGVLGERQPLRVILDARGRVSSAARLFHEPGNVVVATTAASDGAWRTELTATGAEVVVLEPGATGINLAQLLQALGRRGILSAWVEGGSTVLGSAFDEDLVDEVWAFIAPKLIGGRGLPAIGGVGADTMAAATTLREPTTEMLGDDLLVRGYTGRWQPTTIR
jgi:diaminohydroxyphosphoribosylaminopyrimidine deaminase/5-amino-6-(5-phosphoribosylamino)uracil reductase